MRIAIYSDNFYPEISGIHDSVEALAKALAVRGHEVDFHVPRYTRRDFARANCGCAELDIGRNIRIHRLLSLPFPTATRQSRLALPLPSLCSPRANRPDVIHSQSCFGAGLLGLMVGRALGIPVLGTNHTAIRSFASYMPLGCADQATAYLLWYYRRCDLVTAPSRSTFAALSGYGQLPDFHVVSNPIATDIFKPASQDVKRKLRAELRIDGPTIVYAGRLAGEKNIDQVLHALALVRASISATHLIIAGHGSEEDHLRNLARRLEIESGVTFTGTVSKPELAKLFQAADVFATMSTSETQCLALLHAMACGLPVIAAKAGALPEYVESERGFLVAPEDIATLGERLITLLTDADLCSRLGRSGASFALHFSADRIADLWEALYGLALGNGKKG